MARMRKPNVKEMLAAIRRRDIQLLRRLLAQGADPNAVESFTYVTNVTILSCAAGAQFPEAVELLLKSGADANVPAKAVVRGERAGETALHSAIYGSDTRPGNGRRSTEGYRLKIVELLLSADADPNAVSGGDSVPLYEAAEKGKIEICRRLINAGATFKTWPEGCKPPLFGAAIGVPPHGVVEGRGQEGVARLLLDLGAPVDGETADGMTALMGAAIPGSESLVNLFLDHGADVNHRSRNGRTPLLCAASYAQIASADDEQQLALRILNRLLQAGADVNARNAQGEGAYDIASRFRSSLASEYLKQLAGTRG